MPQKNRHKLSTLIHLVEKKFDHGPSSKWKNRDFEELSFQVNLETKILISSATLKRIFGKVRTAGSYTPQESTIEALSLYTKDIQIEKKKTNKLLVYLMSAVALVGFVFLILNFSSKDEIPRGVLTVEKIEGKGHGTVFLNYDVPEFNDSVFINFGDKPDSWHIGYGRHSITHFYSKPGYYNCVLQTRKTNVSNVQKVLIPSDGWHSVAYYFDQELFDRYYPIPLDQNVNDGVFHASRKRLADLGIDLSKIVVVRFENYAKTNYSGDAFHFKTRFKNSSFWPAIHCFSTYISIVGTDGKVMFKLVGEGCSYHSELTIGEKRKWGGNTDLSAFAVNKNEWSEIEIVNRAKNVQVLKSGEEIFSDSYSQSIGNILGVSIMFHGSGSVDYCRVNNFEGDTIFKTEF